MQDERKTKAQLIEELRQLRTEVAGSVNKHPGEEHQINLTHLTGIVDTASDAIISIDGDQNILVFNKGAEQMFGYDHSEVIGKPLDIIIPETLRDAHRKHVGEFGEAREKLIPGSARMELSGQRKNGEIFPAEISISRLRIKDKKIFTAVLRDITERKKAEKLLQESEERFPRILDSAMEAIISADENQHIIFFNNGAETIFGYTQKEVMGQRLEMLLPERFREAHRLHVNKFINDEAGPDRYRKPCRKIFGLRKNGEEFPLEGSISRVPISGKKTVTAVLHDITKRKKAEEALEKSEKQMKSIFDAANDAIFIVDPFNDKIVDANPKAAVLLGYSIEDLKGMPMSALHPEDMDQLTHFANEVLKQGKGFTNELHCKTKSGALLPAEISASSIQLGDRSLMLALVRDITARKRAEQALENSEERLRKTVRYAPIPIMIHAEDGEVVTISETWTKLTGYSHSDIPTIDAWTAKAYGESKDEKREIIAGLYDNQEPGGDGTYTIRTASGSKRIWDFYSTHLGKLKDGRRFIVSMAQDVTDQKLAEHELQMQIEKLKRFNKVAVGREIQMIELKKEINMLLEELGQKSKYTIHEPGGLESE